jgi:methylated-DNA-[protein]-cysteine S-methyltransferase
VIEIPVKISTIKLGSNWFSLAFDHDLRLIANSIPSTSPEESRRSLTISLAARRIKEYFESVPDPTIVEQFTSALNSGIKNIRLSYYGIPQFQKQVLIMTTMIPKGRVATYRSIAAALGKPNAQRAVGNALARNPFPVIIPCHRVIRSYLSLGGYSGAHGTKIKEILLIQEGVKIQNGKVMEKFLLASDMLSYRSSLCP